MTGAKESRGTPLKGLRENDVICASQQRPPGPELKLMCCGHKRGGRNLIVCIDGTANQFGTKNTNVIEIYNLILKETGDNQRTWYNSGIGTYARPDWKSLKYYEQVLVHKIDLAIAWNLEKTVQAAYRWLSDNYEDGDTIFLFGFSRGAFQVRALSAMIEKVGLIHKGNEMQIPFAYELYADAKTDDELIAPVGSTKTKASPEQAAAEPTSIMDRFKAALRFTKKTETPAVPAGSNAISLAERFKRAFSRKNVKVHFVGAWDTVSSIGLARGKQVLPKTTEGMGHVCFFRHALALDERRVKFLPEYAWGSTTLPPKSGADKAQNKSPSGSNVDNDQNDGPPKVMEVWFAGTHSDIGGGNAQNIGMDRSRPPLRWMASEAESLGLRLQAFERELSSDEQIEFQESLTWPWKPFEVFPFQRLTFARNPGPNSKKTTRSPHLGSGRKIHQGQKIHSSLILAETTRRYIPKARPPTNRETFWDELRDDGLSNSYGWLEIDIFGYARAVLKKLMDGKDVEDTLSQIVRDHSGKGAQAVYDEIIEIISPGDHDATHAEATEEATCRLLRTAIDILTDHSESLVLRYRCKIGTMLAHLLTSEEGNKVVGHFLRRYTKGVNYLFELGGHRWAVGSVAISPDGKRIVSGSDDDTIRIWDMETGEQVGETLRGHDNNINSVAISPNGKLIVSGSTDWTIRIWDAETGMQVGESLQGHKGPVYSVVFSHDGKRIVSGSGDNTIRIWDAETGTQVGDPLQGHTASILTIAMSPDDKHIVSWGGFRNRTIRVWDAETGAQVGEALQGHTSSVWSVAISPDGKRIVSGSGDETIRIWDAEIGTQVGEPLQGHSGRVNSVAISPDGKHIVSGSNDKTIRIWDLETEEQVGEPLQGHTSSVMSVAISPDGKRIVSGSHDNTVRIWYAEGILV